MREHFQRSIRDDLGHLVLSTSVRLLEPGTSTPISDTVYLAATGTDSRTNPWVSEDGLIDFYLARPRIVDIGVTASGSATEVITSNVAVGDEEVYKETFTFTLAGAASVQTGLLRFYIDDACEVLRVRVACGTAPSGADLIVDVNKNASGSIFPTQGDRARVADGANTGIYDFPSAYALAEGDYLSLDLDQVGSTSPGAQVVVQVRIRRLS